LRPALGARVDDSYELYCAELVDQSDLLRWLITEVHRRSLKVYYAEITRTFSFLQKAFGDSKFAGDPLILQREKSQLVQFNVLLSNRNSSEAIRLGWTSACGYCSD
jgi:hypothetical protein